MEPDVCNKQVGHEREGEEESVAVAQHCDSISVLEPLWSLRKSSLDSSIIATTSVGLLNGWGELTAATWLQKNPHVWVQTQRFIFCPRPSIPQQLKSIGIRSRVLLPSSDAKQVTVVAEQTQ